MPNYTYKTFKKEKWLYFALSIVVYFVPLIVVTACLFPFMKKADAGYRWGLGIVMFLINAIPFVMGIFRNILAHFPMLNTVAIVFCVLGTLFNFEIFAEYMDKFLWIEFTALVSSIVSCIFWGLYRKYAKSVETIKTINKSGIMNTAGGNNAQP